MAQPQQSGNRDIYKPKAEMPKSAQKLLISPIYELMNNPIGSGGADFPVRPLRIAFVGNDLPRRCGIATFTTVEDVAKAVLYFAAAKTNALTGQSLVVSHGWFIE